MPIGNMLRDRQEQYVAQKDNTGTWRILDTWHEDLTKLSPEDEIDDSSEAVTVLAEGALENEALADQVTELKEENSRLQLQIETTPAVEVTHEEKAGLKQHAIDTIAKIVAIDSVEITKE